MDSKITEGEVVAHKLKLDKPWDKAAIKADQDGIKLDLGKLDLRIQANHMQCLMHAMVHGDTSLERRLLIDIIEEKSGYRRKGLIAHMRLFTPMELKGDVINLSGTVTADWQLQIAKLAEGIELPAVGEKRPFLLELALAHPFTSLEQAREQVAWRPFYKDSIVSRIDKANRDYRAAVSNTLIVAGQPPKPIDPSKPFYDGIHLDKMDNSFDKLEAILNEMDAWKDSTKVVREAHAKAAEAERELAEATK